jgi:hypothetical protein
MDEWPATGDHVALTSELRERLQSVTERADLPPQLKKDLTHQNAVRTAVIGLAAAWGRLTHRLPIRMARRLAMRISTDADEPAMFTIIIGIGLVLVTYAIQLTLVGTLVHSFLIASLYLVALLAGAHWAAFEPHLKR